MPLPEGTRYGWNTFPSGKQVRLAFGRGSNRVIEAKSASGAVHTPEEFAADRRAALSPLQRLALRRGNR